MTCDHCGAELTPVRPKGFPLGSPGFLWCLGCGPALDAVEEMRLPRESGSQDQDRDLEE